MVPDPSTAEWALIVGIVLARLLVPLLIPRCELVIVVALVLDAVDNSLLAVFTDVDLGPDGPYQSVDKALDVYYLAIAYAAMLRNWTSHAAFRIGQFLFYYRLVGVLAFELLDSRAMLLVFPNTFEYFFIAYALVALRWEPASWSPRFWLWTAIVLWVCVKLPQEYWIHIAQRDFTDTVADYPWFGVVCALGLLVLAALLQLVARPRLPAPEHGWRLAAAPLPDRPSHPGGWSEAAEKTALLGLISILFAEILPDVETSALEVGVGVALIVGANTAISLRLRTLELGALLVTNLALIYVLSRFFTAAENFPLGTALFFAFLISLLLALYDRYKPVHDARFARNVSSSP
ncbi:hypothetical protein DVA67_017945 [Solirubrobacter sp. CPCC 204708]|uniref:Uncharacterized protein n=1 Tax=Solirubrobacter deserti TaxID=2282478 RepID=A0ABT4RCU3_9ACTN|nr:hypothetical protein [Solirubrobacter deserti]MBE2317869.1 hypothetical protein [Solirubrobacter deserti]MDA0136354.1 hypothetical protein [Solirubrobacter deserti]